MTEELRLYRKGYDAAKRNLRTAEAHAERLEARVERLEAALREIVKPPGGMQINASGPAAYSELISIKRIAREALRDD